MDETLGQPGSGLLVVLVKTMAGLYRLWQLILDLGATLGKRGLKLLMK